MLKTENTYRRSKYRDVLWFKDRPPGKAIYFEEPFEDYSLEGRVLFNAAGDLPWVFSIHGARADFTKSDAVSFGLQQRGYSLLSMNMSGHNEAGTRKLEETTLGDNVKEAESFYKYLDPSLKKVVIAYSLGGTPALNLLRDHSADIDKLVLFYPGIYTREAYEKHFGKEFKETVSQPFSYQQNDTIELLQSFQGDLLLVKGQYDGLDPQKYGKKPGGSAGEVIIDGQKYYSPIPKAVIDMIYDAVPENRRTLIEIPKCGHSVVLWMREHPTEAEEFLGQIDTFLKR